MRIKNKILRVQLFCILSLSISFCFGQNIKFVKEYFKQGKHFPTSLIETADSGFVIMGYHYSGLVPGNAFFFKLNKYGDSTYYRTYLKDSSVVYYSAKQNDSVILVTPLIFSKNKYINLAKVSSINGDTISNWNYFLPNYPTGYSRLIFLLKNSDILLINTWAGNYNIMRLNSNGQIIWHTGTPMAGIINCIEDYDGNIIEVGADPTSIDPYHVRKLDSAGNVIWDRTYGNNAILNSNCGVTSVVQMEDSNYLATTDNYDWHLMKLDRNTGDTLWTRLTNSDIGLDEIFYNNNNTFVALGGVSFYCFNSNGDTVWQVLYVNKSGKGFYPLNLIKTMDGGYAYSGYLYNPQFTIQSVLIVKTDSLGNTIFTSQIEIPNETELLIYPNPTSDMINITMPSEMHGEDVTVTVYDGLGSEKLLIKSDKFNAENNQIDCSGLANGLYTMSVQNDEHRYWQKFVVLH